LDQERVEYRMYPADVFKLMENNWKLWQKGGFNLKKFACNKNDVLKAIPENRRVAEQKQISSVRRSRKRLVYSGDWYLTPSSSGSSFRTNQLLEAAYSLQ